MLKAKLGVIVSLVVLVLSVSGCYGSITQTTTEYTTPATTTIPFAGFEPPQNTTWISPGKVNVANFHPGATAQYPITIHNGNSVTISYKIVARVPDNVTEEWTKATEKIVQDWVIVADPTPVLMPYETRDIMVTLNMPKNTVSPALKWEFWVSVMDATQSGMIKTEMCCRWLIDMR